MGKVYENVTALGLGVVGNRHSSGGIGGDAVQEFKVSANALLESKSF